MGPAQTHERSRRKEGRPLTVEGLSFPICCKALQGPLVSKCSYLEREMEGWNFPNAFIGD